MGQSPDREVVSVVSRSRNTSTDTEPLYEGPFLGRARAVVVPGLLSTWAVVAWAVVVAPMIDFKKALDPL